LQAIVKQQEKLEKANATKLKTTVEKYREVCHYLEKELDFQRQSHEDTIELFRKLEKTLRDTVYRCESAEDRVLVLQDELNRAKTELHRYKNKLYEEVRKTINFGNVI
jgi:chromosome segregation ATPase